VKFRYWVGLRDVEYGHACIIIFICFISINKQPSNMHANKQLVHNENWILN